MLLEGASLLFLLAISPRNVLASIPSPDSYWQVTPPLNYSDVLYAGWDQIPVEKEVLIYNGSLLNRTYTHHPQLYADGSTVYLVHSSAVIDEDSMGMELWGSISLDSGHTWTPSQSLLPASLLPNQTSVANFSYWCNEAIWQRAIGGLAVLPLSDGSIWGVGETTDYFCWGTIGSGTRGAGRIARQIASADGSPLGDPCWLDQNNWTYVQAWNETVYGTEYGMRFCDAADEMNAYLDGPANVPAWSAWLYNDVLYAANNWSSLQEVTHAVWIEGSEGEEGYWQRFWRDISPAKNSMRVWAETTFNRQGGDWYPVLEEQYGNQVRGELHLVRECRLTVPGLRDEYPRREDKAVPRGPREQRSILYFEPEEQYGAYSATADDCDVERIGSVVPERWCPENQRVE